MTHVKNEIQIFKSPQFGELHAVITENGKPLFIANYVAKALGYTNPQKAIRDHCKGVTKRSGVSKTTNQYGKTTEQIVEFNFIPESDVYRLIMRSKLPQAEQFQDWVVEEVLPSIRKSGGYMATKPDETPEELLSRALLIANDALNRTEERADRAEKKALSLETQNKAQVEMMEARDKRLKSYLPKVIFASAVETSGSSILVGDLARIIRQNGVEIGQNRLFEWMRKSSFLIRKCGESYNHPTQKALNMGLFEIKKTVITKPDGESLVITTPKVTGKGQIYFMNRFLYDTVAEDAKGGEQ